MSSELEQFCLVARSQKDRACAAIIQQVLKDKKIHVFGELLSIPSVQALRHTEFENALLTLELFAYGSYDDYLASPVRFLEVSPIMAQKLRRMTLFSLASESQSLQYDFLLQRLHLSTVRELEDFIIETLYAGLIAGKLNQLQRVFTVVWVTPRDLPPAALDNMITELSEWQARCVFAQGMLQRLQTDLAQRRDGEEKQSQDLQAAVERQKDVFRDYMESGAMDVDEYEYSMRGARDTGGSGGIAVKSSSSSIFGRVGGGRAFMGTSRSKV